MANYHANGKLLLTAEYFVLDGALALALPCRVGQSLTVLAHDIPEIHWHSFDEKRTLWFEGRFKWPPGKYLEGSDQEVGEQLSKIFRAIRASGGFQHQGTVGWRMETRLEFPRKWGLGTSSTLIANLARWKGVNAYQLQEDTFGGSGYDVACAFADGPILYRRNRPRPTVTSVVFEPPFYDQLYFVYLGKKQNSREGITHYRERGRVKEAEIKQMTQLTKAFVVATSLEEFEALIREHEAIVTKKIKIECAKTKYFSDFWGEIKSLGAWGGDFVLATSQRSASETLAYFQNKGFPEILKYADLIL